MPTPTDDRVARTLRLSVYDGVGYSVMVGAGESYFVPWAIFLGASNGVLGALVAFPQLIGSLSQLATEWLIRLARSRRRLVLWCVSLQALTFVPIFGLTWCPAHWRSAVLVTSVCAYWTFQLVAAPAWSSWLGDLVPSAHRGAYFGRRSRVMQLATFGSMLLAGLALTEFRDHRAAWWGFAAIFGLSLLARLVSFALLWMQHESTAATAPDQSAWLSLRRTFENPPRRRLVLYLSSMSFAVYVAAPYFAPFMLRTRGGGGLAWSYATFTLVTGIAVLSKFVFLPLWGRAADRFGARRCLVLSGWLIVALPLPWLVPATWPKAQLVVLLLAQVWSGLAWAGHELCSFTFLLESAPAAERTRLAAAMSMANGIMLFAGASLGALLVKLAPLGLNPFLFVFCASSALRLLVVAMQVRQLSEVRPMEPISYGSLLFRVVSVRPQAGAVLRFFPPRPRPRTTTPSDSSSSGRS